MGWSGLGWVGAVRWGEGGRERGPATGFPAINRGAPWYQAVGVKEAPTWVGCLTLTGGVCSMMTMVPPRACEKKTGEKYLFLEYRGQILKASGEKPKRRRRSKERGNHNEQTNKQ